MIVVICGFSGAGKDTLASLLEQDGFTMIKSCTSRPMRDNESEGIPYYFKTKEEMLSMKAANEFIEIREYSTLVQGIPETWYYGVHKAEVQNPDSKYVVVLDILGLKDFKREFNEKVISFFIDLPEDIREARAKLRGSFDEQEWRRRLEADRRDFNQLEIIENCNFIIENIELTETLERIKDELENFN